jgi:hypothetical protein
MEKGNDGQHRGDGTGAVNNGQKTNIRHDPELGRKPVPAGRPDGDISTQSRVSRGKEPK